MPIIPDSNYKPVFVFQNSHFNTIYSALFRQIPNIKYSRERINTPDHDFIDLDFFYQNSSKAILVLHGLESSSSEAYIKGTIKIFDGWDGIAMNFRGCSGEDNYLLKSYHGGATEDLETILEYILKTKKYAQIGLIGFSLGGNLLLKYLGEKKHNFPSQIKWAAAVSVPCCLKSSSERLATKSNFIYMQTFLNKLKQKIKLKAQKFKGEINYKNFANLKNFYDFDNFYTAPFHDFKDAEDYWTKCSSKNFISDIKIPTLLINALDDPFLGLNCYPYAEAEKSSNLFFQTPQYGGHIGFANLSQRHWHEIAIKNFVEAIYSEK